MLGCSQPEAVPVESPAPATTSASEQRPLKLVVVDDDSLATVAAREWTARASRRLDIVTIDSTQFGLWLKADAGGLADSDAVICASCWVGELAARGLIEPMPDFVRQNASFADGDIGFETDFLPLYRQSVMTWGETICGLPLGGHVFVLGYRTDIFESLGLPAPRSLEAVRAAVQAFLEGDKKPEWPEIAIAQPLAETWAAHTFLAHAAPYCRHRNRFSALFELRTMEPEINGPEYQRALRELTEDARRGSDARCWEQTPTQTFQSLFRGECVMAIGWPDAIDETTTAGDLLDRIAIIEFPGSRQVYDRFEGAWHERVEGEATHVPYLFPEDRMAVVLKSSRSQRAAWNLVAHLTGKSWGTTVAAASPATGPYRRSQLSGTTWTRGLPSKIVDEYRRAWISTATRRTFLSRLRLPANQAYLDALDAAVRACRGGSQTSDRELDEVATTWRRITEQQGQRLQIDAFHRSLGLEP